MKEILEDLGFIFVTIFAIFAGVCIVTAVGHWLDNKAVAKPVTTEVPEYIAKCSKPQIPHACEEYTIYRITRN